MSTVPDKRQLRIRLPGEGTDPVGPSGVGSAPAGHPPVACGDPVEASEAHREALPAVESMSVGLQLLEAMKPFLPTPAVPEGPVAVDAAFPEVHALPSLHLQMKAVLEAIEHATSEEEVMASLETFLTTETAVPSDTDTLAVLTTLFGPECVTAVIEVGAAAVADLEAEAASTGGTISERAASRIARSMVHRVTTRAGRMMARPPRARPALRVRSLRAPRARRAPRRAVHLAAVASAGDGPPPERGRAFTRAREGAHLSFEGTRPDPLRASSRDTTPILPLATACAESALGRVASFQAPMQSWAWRLALTALRRLAVSLCGSSQPGEDLCAIEVLEVAAVQLEAGPVPRKAIRILVHAHNASSRSPWAALISLGEVVTRWGVTS